jgi:hypothetical protein
MTELGVKSHHSLSKTGGNGLLGVQQLRLGHKGKKGKRKITANIFAPDLHAHPEYLKSTGRFGNGPATLISYQYFLAILEFEF